MYTKESYFCKYPDGKTIWFAPDKEIEEGYLEKQIRIMIYPEEGKVLKNKMTNEFSYGRWIQEKEIQNWEDVDIPENISEDK